ncbi:MAG: lactate racemase domain-containing protein, partial [Planctomycetota bacterium]|nr:lactate racemase domain-containing protein [Planctomycetota bacterium]
MHIDLAYGRDGTTVEVPEANLVAVVEPHWPEVLRRPQEAVAEALAAPVDGPPLSAVAAEALAGGGPVAGAPPGQGGPRGCRAVILVSDSTRPCPNREVLLPILAALRRAGVGAGSVTVLIATGLHEPVRGEAVRRLLGEEVVRAVRVENHRARRPDTLIHLGETEAGTPVDLAAAWVEADLRIATGVVEPHLSAGFSGGRKAICPGIAGTDTVMAFHGPRFIEHDRTRPGVLEGNPTHAEALAVARFAPPHFTVNVTVDRHERLTGVFAGTMVGAHAA